MVYTVHKLNSQIDDFDNTLQYQNHLDVAQNCLSPRFRDVNQLSW
jgi:conjugal transfer/entry exclusion protein